MVKEDSLTARLCVAKMSLYIMDLAALRSRSQNAADAYASMRGHDHDSAGRVVDV